MIDQNKNSVDPMAADELINLTKVKIAFLKIASGLDLCSQILNTHLTLSLVVQMYVDV